MLAASETRTRRLQAITAEIDAAMFNDHPEVQALKARITEAKAAHDAAAAEAKAAPQVDISGVAIERTSRALREQIAERERGLESLALEALLAGDLEGQTYAAAQTELQAVRWQLEGLELGYKLLLRTAESRARGLGAGRGADPVRAAQRRIDSMGTQLGELLATLTRTAAEKRLAQQDEENAAARAAGKPRPHPEHVGTNLASRFRKTGAPERNRLGRPI